MLDQDSTLRDLECWVFHNEWFKDNYHSVHCVIYMYKTTKSYSRTLRALALRFPLVSFYLHPFHKFQWPYVRPQIRMGVQALHLVVRSSKTEPIIYPAHILFFFFNRDSVKHHILLPLSNIFTKIKCWSHHSPIWFLGDSSHAFYPPKVHEVCSHECTLKGHASPIRSKWTRKIGWMSYSAYTRVAFRKLLH